MAPWPDYWLRVWGARGLLWKWDADSTAAIVTALDDEAWRVREMAAKVVARYRIADGLESVVAAQQDSNTRVRSAARRAVFALTSCLHLLLWGHPTRAAPHTQAPVTPLLKTSPGTWSSPAAPVDGQPVNLIGQTHTGDARMTRGQAVGVDVP